MKNNYQPPYGLILLLISILNIMFSSYFISLFLAGVVFKIFKESLKKQYYYILGFSIVAFLIIEVTQGFQTFLLTIVSIVLYYIIIPKIKHTFSSPIMLEIIYILLFYIIVFVVTAFYLSYNIDMLYIFTYNFFIDIFIAGFIL